MNKRYYIHPKTRPEAKCPTGESVWIITAIILMSVSAAFVIGIIYALYKALEAIASG